MNLQYDFEFTNGNGPFHKHFSADQFGKKNTNKSKATTLTTNYYILFCLKQKESLRHQ